VRAKKSWFSFARVPDPGDHRIYNAYHQLDHRPENLLLPGVLWGDRWVCSPRCAAAATAGEPALRDVHYLVNYLFEAPVGLAIEEWQTLSWTAFQEGRRPETGLVERPFMGWFTPFKSYVNARARVSADALPLRPMRGVYVTISQILRDADPSQVHELLAWEDQVRIPALLDCPGVAGAMAHLSDPAHAAPFSTSAGIETLNDRANLRLHVFYLDGDPLEVLAEFARRTPQWQAHDQVRDTGAVLTPLYASPLETITPWQWDWF
jgi:hypothetical protein